MESLSRKERERLNRRREMLQAGIRVFAEKGYERASIEEIAQRAEFGKGTLYLYFPKGKEEMLRAIVQDLAEEEFQLVENVFLQSQEQQRSFEQTFRAFIRAYLDHYHQEKDHFRLVVKVLNRLMLSDEDALKELVLSLKAKTISRFSGFLEEAMQRGEVRSFHAEALTHMIFGNLHGYIMYDTFLHNPPLPCTPTQISPANDAQEWLCLLLLHGISQQPSSTAVLPRSI
ncbi:MAG: TetR/AcrR family transcriptional regulator [Bacteroidetes Order II. Incertae sedis bacterium]|nr:TetR/AcrR family transcriptional regulator [Bacteroidetes Order II. bacterium]